MKLKAELLNDHSRKHAEHLADLVINKSYFNELVEVMLGKDKLLSQRAAWPFGVCLEKQIDLILPYRERLIRSLDKNYHPSVKRNILKHLQYVEIPLSIIGVCADYCFKLLSSGNETIAVKVFCMPVLLNICKLEPDLCHELKFVINEQMPYASAGFKSRGKKVIAELNKIKPNL